MLLEYFKAEKLLKRYGINSVPGLYVSSPDEAVRFARGSAVVLKVLSDEALHKSSAGLVKVNLRGEGEIESAFRQLSQRRRALGIASYKVLCQKMAEPGVEAILGGREDPQFGRLMMLGLGGIYVEAFRDFALRICPIKRYDAEEMINQLMSGAVLTYKGKNREMLISLLMNVSRLLSSEKGIKELDLNPVILRERSYSIVDLRLLG